MPKLNFKLPISLMICSSLFLFISGCGGGGDTTLPASGPAVSITPVEPVPAPAPDPNSPIPVATFSTTPTSGLAALTVAVDASGSSDSDGNIVEYRWDFGDGNTALAQATTHIYSQPGSYTIRLVVTDNDGNSASTSNNVNVFASIDNSSAIVPNGVTFYDNFDYVAGRDDPNVVRAFQNAGWAGAKTVQAGEPGARGYIYTTDHIPGYNGPFPGSNSNRVLALEALPNTLGNHSTGFWGDLQTDFYLQYGNSNGSRETIPGNVWFQFWIYPNYYDDPNDQEDQLSGFDRRFKFLYPCNGNYPCSRYNWLYMLGGTSDLPYFKELGTPSRDLYMQLHKESDIYFRGAPEGKTNAHKLGQTNIFDYIHHNQWTLVKLHIDTSTTSGKWEAWIKPLGGKWVKIANWFDGADRLTWKVADPGGHRILRMPTTLAKFNAWIYMDDFVIAKSEDALPKYN
jgi:PKD repeat protein